MMLSMFRLAIWSTRNNVMGCYGSNLESVTFKAYNSAKLIFFSYRPVILTRPRPPCFLGKYNLAVVNVRWCILAFFVLTSQSNSSKAMSDHSSSPKLHRWDGIILWDALILKPPIPTQDVMGAPGYGYPLIDLSQCSRKMQCCLMLYVIYNIYITWRTCL